MTIRRALRSGPVLRAATLLSLAGGTALLATDDTVAASRAVMAAPSINAPLWSVTVPLMLPSWPHTGMAITKQAAKQTNKARPVDGMKLAWFM